MLPELLPVLLGRRVAESLVARRLPKTRVLSKWAEWCAVMQRETLQMKTADQCMNSPAEGFVPPSTHLGSSAPSRAHAGSVGDAVSWQKLQDIRKHLVVEELLNGRELRRLLLCRMLLGVFGAFALALMRCLQALPLEPRPGNARVVQLQPRPVCRDVWRGVIPLHHCVAACEFPFGALSCFLWQ